LPLLSRWLDRKTPPWRVRLGQRLWPRGITTGVFPPDQEKVLACHAIIDLSADGVFLAPQLAALCAEVDGASTVALGVLTRQVHNWRNEMSLSVEADLQKALDATIRELTARSDAQTNSVVMGRVSVLKKLKSMIGQEAVRPGEDVGAAVRPSAAIATN